ncbi:MULTISPECIES: hypothetical protein [Methylotenera]|uniref:hypothetical protein n=1 Tax=Methylotenera TaxID=359407 RepID=UPI00036B00F5|nr:MULTISPECIES: hypothetical protein [Methylotenera]
MKPVLKKSIVLQLSPSPLLLGLLALVATASATIILVAPIILPIKFAIFVLIIASTAYFIGRDALLMLPWSWQTIEIDVQGNLKLTNKKQQEFKPQLAITSFTHQHLTILNFKRNGLKKTLPPVLLLPNFIEKDDCELAEKDALRRLRVWVRLFKHDK